MSFVDFMQNKPLFTVATITYNSGIWVRDTIQSILSQSYGDFELIISDDCSSDNTWEIINEYQDQRVRAYRNETNIGEYPNRNKALSLAQGKYLLYVDGDDILYKHTLETLSWFVKAFPEAGMIWGISSDVMPFMVFPYMVNPKENIKLLYCTTLPIADIGFGEILFEVNALKRIGGLSNNFKHGDTYVKKRLALTEKVLYVSRGMVFWRHSSGQASRLSLDNYKSMSERIIIDRELMQLPDFKIEENWLKIIKRNNLVRDTKSVVRNTILKGKITDFFILSKRLGFGISKIKYLFIKGIFSYRPVENISRPLKNDYNFK